MVDAVAAFTQADEAFAEFEQELQNLAEENDPTDAAIQRAVVFNKFKEYVNAATGETGRPVTEYAHDGVGQVVSMTEKVAAGVTRTTHYDYDLLGRLTRVVEPNPLSGGEWTAEHDPWPLDGNPFTKYEYDVAGNLTAELLPDVFGTDSWTSFATTSYAYDAYGRLEETVLADPDGAEEATSPVTSRAYDDASNLVTITDANGHTTTNQYDLFNRAIATTDAEGNTTRFTYDTAGQLVATIDALGRAVHRSRDERGRVVVERLPDPDGAGPLIAPETRYKYDDVGNRTQITNAAGHITQFEYNELNRLETERTTDPRVADNSAATGDASFVATGTATTTSDTSATDAPSAEDAYGNDYTVITGVGSTTPKATWTFDDLPAGTYRVALTWDPRDVANLDTAAVAQIYVNGVKKLDASGQAFSQQDAPRDLALGYQGEWLGWKEFTDTTEFVVPAGGTLKFELKGSSASAKIMADAVRIERVDVERTFTYDATGNLESESDTLDVAGDRTTTYGYDELGRLETTTLPDPDGAATALHAPVTKNIYDGFGNVTSIQEIRNGVTFRTTAREYDKRNRPTEQTLATGSTDALTTRYEYDDAGNLQRLLEAYGSADEVVTEYDYDNLNRRTAEIVDVGRVGDINSRTPQVERTDYKYDAVGNLTESKLTTTEKSLSANSASTVTTFEYDGANRLVKEVADAGTGSHFVNATTQYVYDAVGNVLREIDPTGRVTDHEYDRLGRLVKTTLPDPDGSGPLARPGMSHAYDALGNLVGETNGEGETEHTIHDTLGRTERVIDGEGNETRYQYDSEGNLLRLTDAEKNETSFAYDRLNRLTTETNELEDSRTTSHDDRGNVAGVVDRNGRLRTFAYDFLDRLETETWYDGATTAAPVAGTLSWSYDKLGRTTLAKQVDGAGTILSVETFDYDSLGRVTAARNFDPNGPDAPGVPEVSHIYAYDLVDPADVEAPLAMAVVPITTGTALAITYRRFDRLGRLVTIDDNVLAEAAAGQSDKQIDFTYDAADRLTEVARRSAWNGASHGFVFDTTYAYDGVGRLEAIDHQRGAGLDPVAHFGYVYDDASRIAERESTFAYTNLRFTRSESFAYDAAGRLTETEAGYVNQGGLNLGFAIENAFTLDGTGNRAATSTGGGAAVAAEIDPNNRLEDDGASSYQYDGEGNLERRDSQSDNSYSLYTWDHAGRLTEAKHYDAAGLLATHVRYRYNHNDLRVRKEIVGTATEHYALEGDRVALVFEGATGSASALARRYQYAPGTDMLLVDEVFNAAGQAERAYWAVTDQAGTVHELLESDADGEGADSNHDLVEHRDYDASGRIARAIDAGGNDIALDELFSDHAYAGREWDGEAGLYYNRARWLDPNTGRFISEDPSGFAGGDPNLYRYAGGDPVNYRDPSGLRQSGNPLLSSVFTAIANLADPTPGNVLSRSISAALPSSATFQSISGVASNVIDAGNSFFSTGLGGDLFRALNAQSAGQTASSRSNSGYDRLYQSLRTGISAAGGEVSLSDPRAKEFLAALHQTIDPNPTAAGEVDVAESRALMENIRNLKDNAGVTLDAPRTITAADIEFWIDYSQDVRSGAAFKFAQNHPVLTGTISEVTTNLAYGSIFTKGQFTEPGRAPIGQIGVSPTKPDAASATNSPSTQYWWKWCVAKLVKLA